MSLSGFSGVIWVSWALAAAVVAEGVFSLRWSDMIGAAVACHGPGILQSLPLIEISSTHPLIGRSDQTKFLHSWEPTTMVMEELIPFMDNSSGREHYWLVNVKKSAHTIRVCHSINLSSSAINFSSARSWKAAIVGSQAKMSNFPRKIV
jgi:hypothetical protein